MKRQAMRRDNDGPSIERRYKHDGK